MTEVKKWKDDYDAGRTLDCPCCGRDKPDHSCGNCYSEMDKDTCWRLNGYCSEKCKTYVEMTLPAIRKQKEEMGLACKCDEPQCAKCLSVNCKDDNCPTHTDAAKARFKTRTAKSKDI